MQRALVRLEREQQALRASEESFRQAFEYAPSGMAIAEMGGDQHGRILRTNDALCRLLGRPASAMRRYSFSDLVHPEDIGTLLRTSAEGGRAELRLGRRDGTYVWVSLRNSVVADAAAAEAGKRAARGGDAEPAGVAVDHGDGRCDELGERQVVPADQRNVPADDEAAGSRVGPRMLAVKVS